MSAQEPAEFAVSMKTVADQLEQYLDLCRKAAPLLAKASPEHRRHWEDVLQRVKETRPSLQRAARASERIEKALGKALAQRRRGIFA